MTFWSSFCHKAPLLTVPVNHHWLPLMVEVGCAAGFSDSLSSGNRTHSCGLKDIVPLIPKASSVQGLSHEGQSNFKITRTSPVQLP